MKVLAIDTSTMMGSVALLEDDRIVAEGLLNVEVTHSERLISSVDDILKMASVDISDVDLFAVAIGPGSFTGLRIGLAAVKGFAFSLQKPIVGVSTLKALAYNAFASELPVVSLLNARRGEFYVGAYSFKKNGAKEILKESVMPPDRLVSYLKSLKKKMVLVGDGVYHLHDDQLKGIKNRIVSVPPAMVHPRASNVAWLALEKFQDGKIDDPNSLVPNYIRTSDAEHV